MQPAQDRVPLATERTLVWLVSSLSVVAAVLYVLAGWYSGDPWFVVGAVGPATIGALGLFMVRLDRARLFPLLLATSTVIVLENQLLGLEDAANASVIPLTIVGVIGAFFVPERLVLPYITSYAAVMFFSAFQWSHSDTNLLNATIASTSVIAGASLAVWVRKAFDQREELFRTLFQNAPVAMWREDFSSAGVEIDALAAQGIGNFEEYLTENPEEVRRLASLVRIDDVNEAALHLTEAPDRSLLVGNLNMSTFSQGALESFIPQFAAIADDKEKTVTELKRGLTVTGHPIEAIVVWSAPRIDGALDLSNVTVAIVDITRQREAERELENLVRSKDQFVATISHEIRTPLTAVVGITQELRDSAATIEEDERGELLDIVADQGLEVARIVEDLLVVARSDAGNLIVDSRPVDLAVEAISAVQAIDPSIPVDTDGPATVMADARRVRQIVRNLVTNAKRYGGPSIRVVVGAQAMRAEIEVRDDGEPLSQANREAIFEPYARADGHSDVPGSVGLGLTVSRRLARHMGGDLTYDHDGQEAIFSLTLAPAPHPVPVS